MTQIANALTALGVRRPDAVTLSAPNTSMLYAATLAAQAVGIAAPVNPALSDEHLTALIRRAAVSHRRDRRAGTERAALAADAAGRPHGWGNRCSCHTPRRG